MAGPPDAAVVPRGGGLPSEPPHRRVARGGRLPAGHARPRVWRRSQDDELSLQRCGGGASMTRGGILRLAIAGVLLAACGRPTGPEPVALAYGRALYANDADAAWRLISEVDRRGAKRATFPRRPNNLHGFARHAARPLCG